MPGLYCMRAEVTRFCVQRSQVSGQSSKCRRMSIKTDLASNTSLSAVLCCGPGTRTCVAALELSRLPSPQAPHFPLRHAPSDPNPTPPLCSPCVSKRDHNDLAAATLCELPANLEIFHDSTIHRRQNACRSFRYQAVHRDLPPQGRPVYVWLRSLPHSAMQCNAMPEEEGMNTSGSLSLRDAVRKHSGA